MNRSHLGVRLNAGSPGPLAFRPFTHCLLSLGLWSVVCGFPVWASAQDQTISGNLTVTGSIEAAGSIDAGSNTLTFGTQGSGFGGALLHQDSNTDTFTFLSNRNPASWLWQHTVGIAAMRLDSNHQLILYQADGATAGVTLAPASNSIKLGTHANGTLTADANGLITAGGGFSVAGGITNTNGTLTGGATGLTLNSGGTNQNILLNTSGGDLVFSTGSNERMRIKANGNVGVGTANPIQKFQVVGRTGFGLTGSTGQYALTFNPDTAGNTIFHILSGASGLENRLRLVGGADPYNGQTEYLTVQNNGNVGIGTTGPASKLTVGGNPVSAAQFSVLGGSGTAAEIQAGSANNILNLRNATGVATAVFKENGNFGIGTTNPATKLEILDSSSVQTWPLVIRNEYGGTADLKTAGLAFRGGNGNWAAISGGQQDSNNWNYGKLKFGTRTSDAVGVQTKMTLLANGNLGIGTENPSAHLHISSPAYVGGAGPVVRLSNAHDSNALTMDAYTNNTPHSYAGEGIGGGVRILMNPVGGYYGMIGTNNSSRFHIITNATPRLTVSDSGNVGVGTTAPGAPLEVLSTSVAPLILRNTSANGYSGFNAFDSEGMIKGSVVYANASASVFPNCVWLANRGTAMGNDLILATNNTTERVRITNGGNVGIGTTNPTHKLAVKGTIRAEEVIVDTGWADYVFEEDYRLAPLAEVEEHIREKKHLPGIPSAAEVAEHGVSMGDMQSKLLSKVEELTLHLIAQEKKLEAVMAENARLAQRVQTLEGHR